VKKTGQGKGKLSKKNFEQEGKSQKESRDGTTSKTHLEKVPADNTERTGVKNEQGA